MLSTPCLLAPINTFIRVLAKCGAEMARSIVNINCSGTPEVEISFKEKLFCEVDHRSRFPRQSEECLSLKMLKA